LPIPDVGPAIEGRLHELKTWPDLWWAVAEGRKTAEWRKNDRDYRLGDVLRLREYDPESGRYTGAWLDVIVTHLISGPSPFGIPDGFVMMSISGHGQFSGREG
jgi:ParB family transcriptional regulator, chromosome partitioning protein